MRELMMPLVSVIVPCYNEQATIRLLLEALTTQQYPHEEMEVIIADGLSTDRTREEIAVFKDANPTLEIRLVDNPQRHIPAGLNRAIQEARGEFIIRLDAHAMPHPEYVQRCVEALEKGRGENVGGIWDIRPSGDHWVARSIAAAAAHPLGVGDAKYRYSNAARNVETVPFGAFRRTLIDRIGMYDETLLTNEDYELNVRIRQAGGKIWMDPAIRSVYFARPTFSSLASQYWRYGYWKAEMLRRYPRTLRWRQLSALLVLSFGLLTIASLWAPLARLLLLLEAAVYLIVLLTAGTQSSLRHRNPIHLIGVPLAITIMHFSWGTGFLWSLIRAAIKRPVKEGQAR